MCVFLERKREREKERGRARELEREREIGQTVFVGSLRETYISYRLHFTNFGCGQIRKSE
jgi:hypothetical protein